MTAIATPTIHLNGTSGDELQRQVRDVVDALYKALEAARQAVPNGRDYYPQGDSALWKAVDEHRLRIERLQAVLGEYETLSLAIADASD
jgi:hypothetical protein